MGLLMRVLALTGARLDAVIRMEVKGDTIILPPRRRSVGLGPFPSIRTYRAACGKAILGHGTQSQQASGSPGIGAQCWGRTRRGGPEPSSTLTRGGAGSSPKLRGPV